jgi:DNA-binding transcriptional LysR family regulator
VAARDLSKSKWATLNSEGFQRAFMNFFQARGLPLPVQVIRTDSLGLIRRTLINADVLTVMPPDVVRDEIESGKLVVIDCEIPAEVTSVGLVHRADQLITPQMKQLIDRITKGLAAK